MPDFCMRLPLYLGGAKTNPARCSRGRARQAASRPEVVRQAFSAFRVMFLSSGDPRFLNALRYVTSS